MSEIFCPALKLCYNNSINEYRKGELMNAGRGRQYQDSVFRMYFNNEARLRELAGALHGKMYSPGERLEIVTLDGTFLT